MKLIILMATIVGLSLRADPALELQGIVAQQIEQTSSALESAEVPAIAGDSSWLLKNFYLKLQAMVGFQIPAIAKLNLIPTVELVFHKPEPSRK